jgi:phospholipase C
MEKHMEKIKHIVYLMLENRSLDNLLGWLYTEQNPPKVNIPAKAIPDYDGLNSIPQFLGVDIKFSHNYAACA